MSRIDQALARARGVEQPIEAIDSPFVHADVPELPESPRELETRFTLEPRRAPAPVAAADERDDNPTTPLVERIDELISEKLVIGQTLPQSIEQYRRLAATLHELQETRGIKTLLIVSAMPSEGKTLTAANLALTLSESYRREVLLIDADLRRPSVHRVFKLSDGAGLGDGLKATAFDRVPVRRVSDFLSVLPAGNPDPDPMGGLTSPRMKQLLAEAATAFEWVIIDTPPVGLLPDARVLATLADAAVLVVRAGVTPFAMVKKTVEAIGKTRLLGVVLNGTDPSLTDHSYYYTDRGPLGDAKSRT
jgi:capsular exopolysaccharide synthesis family protein